jgi:hypothetical protein
VRGDRAFEAGCGIVRWGIKLGVNDGGAVYVVGVASDAFSDYSASIAGSEIRHAWVFENGAMRADGQRLELNSSCYDRCDVVMLELQRLLGAADSTLRIQVAGKSPQQMRGLPRDGVLYPIVCLVNDQQKATLVALPQ